MSARDAEIISFRNDKNVGGLPRELKRRKSGRPPQPPSLWTSPPTENLGVWGALPKGFVAWAVPQLQCSPREVLHVCSGMLPPGTGRARVDLRAECQPDVVADGRKLPFADQSFEGVLIDPPYSVEYARDLYGTDYPRPSHLLAEATRVTKPNGRIGIVHFLVPMPPPGAKLETVRGITTGCGYRIRALTIFVKEQPRLPLG